MAAVFNLLLSLLSLSALLCFVSTQNPSGFINVDCGWSMNTMYEDPNNGLIYDSDATFIDTGTIHNISLDSIKNHNQQLWSLRSFPKGTRNCYKVRVTANIKYLIRASFLYGDYDGRKELPNFDLHFGPNFWTSVNLDAIDKAKYLEIIHVVSSNYVQVCLINTGAGTPFISALELRPLNNVTYSVRSQSVATLANVLRLDVGSVNGPTYRYKDDIYDRIWEPMAPLPEWTSISTSDPVYANDELLYFPAPAVMSSAITPRNASAPLEIRWISPNNATDQFLVYMYFSEFLKLQSNESRAFIIMRNGRVWHNQPISPLYLGYTIIFSSSPWTGRIFNFSFHKTPNSTLPPILNAIEVYRLLNFPSPQTNEQDVESISKIKAVYGVERNWQGDPCGPTEFIWQGVKCSFVDTELPRITSLDLSSSGLTGKIAKDIALLTMLETLDLSNNNLIGTVPEFLAELPSLKVLNLERNKLSGVIPSQLIQKSNDSSLSLRFGENPNLYITAPSEEKKHNIIVPVLASSVGGLALLLLLALGVIFWIKTKQIKQQGVEIERTNQNVNQSQQLDATKQSYSYSDILRMTNNCERPLGEGGFGKVYYGQIDDIEVAVKMLSPQSAQGHQQFQAEVELLMRVHHKNLTSLVGYCNDSTHKGLIYEYMERGNLGSLISGGRLTKVLNWKDRLLIAVDAAHGLEYLHYGIKPAIIHRDVKSTNILLDNNFRAKLSDFGLSRNFHTEGSTSTHVTITNVVGTHGYIDPEYHTSYRLNEKSDVYGFGVILLEIITGKPALIRTEDQVIHVYQWVKPLLSQGDIRAIMDLQIEEDFEVNSVWKAVDIAMCCVSLKSVDRPNMSEVLVELKECLDMELARHNHSQPELVVVDSRVLHGPSAR